MTGGPAHHEVGGAFLCDRMRRMLHWRAMALRAARAWLDGRGYLEVDPPALVLAPGMEPHIDAFEVVSRQGTVRYLHTSPEYALKRVVAAGHPRVYALGHVFRDEPPSRTHAPEFAMLEVYCPGGEAEIMAELEGLACALARAVGTPEGVGGGVRWEAPFERRSMREVFLEHTGVDIAPFLPPARPPALPEQAPDTAALARALEQRGVLEAAPDEGFDDLFFRAFLDHVEPNLGRTRPLFVTDYPAHMAALSKVREDDPRWARRFELYAAGVELANGFAELDDAAEQRRRLVAEQAERRAAGRPAYPLDEAFLESVGRLPETGGVALGFDRLLMLLLGVDEIAKVQVLGAG